MLLSLFLTSSIPITVSDSPYTSLTTRPPAWNTGGEVYMYVCCINSRIDWVAKYLLKTSWNSNTWYAFQESIFDIFPKRNKYYLHLQFTNNLLVHYILAIRVHIWSACMRSFSRSTVRCALRFGLIFFFVCAGCPDAFVTSSLFAAWIEIPFCCLSHLIRRGNEWKRATRD